MFKKFIFIFLFLMFTINIYGFDNEGALLEDLSKKFDKIGTPTKVETKEDLTDWYIVNVGEIKKNSLIFKNIGYYKLITGKCYYQNDEPNVSTDEDTFVNKLNLYLKNIYGVINRLDETNEYAVVDGYVADNDGLISKQFLITLDNDGKIKAYLIK